MYPSVLQSEHRGLQIQFVHRLKLHLNISVSYLSNVIIVLRYTAY